MRPYGHLAAGLLAAHAASPRELEDHEQLLVDLAGALCGNLPDLDIAAWARDFSRAPSHHDWPTHTPVFWVGAWLAARPKLGRYERALTAATFSHLACDWIDDALQLVWPLSRRRFGLRQGHGSAGTLWRGGWNSSWSRRCEGLMVVLALVTLARDLLAATENKGVPAR